MLPREFLRENAERLLGQLPERYAGSGLERFVELDRLRRDCVTELERKRRRRNDISSGAGKPSAQALSEMKTLKEEIRDLEAQLARHDADLENAERQIPNVPADDVPRGADETANRVERQWGEPPRFDFAAQAHWDLGPALGVLDFERGAKLAGARFTVLKAAGARLSRALANFFLDLQTQHHGYTEILPPAMANPVSLFATGQLPKFEQDLFLTREGYYLIPTAEVPLTNLHRDETLAVEALPLSYTACTPCFRAEAGAAGRDTRGMIRQHQFDKVEIVQLTTPEDSAAALERLTGHAEKALQLLNLPYRVVSLATGDLGFGSSKTYDLEVWLAGQGAFREISSCSNYRDFQARRGHIRLRRSEGEKPDYVHTLNGSALPIGRTLVAILENYQRQDGSIAIPEALQDAFGGKEIR